jgi:hypothetical protein
MNATAKHTPGPWSVPHFARPDVGCECGYVLADGYMGAVATVHCSHETGENWSNGDNPRFDEAVANAHLIAAAPELLRCAKILAGLEAEDGGRTFPTKQDCQFARATIARATGEGK